MASAADQLVTLISLMPFAESLGIELTEAGADHASTSMIESKSNFFRGVSGGRVVATARPVHVGGRTIVVQTDLRDEQAKLVALVTQTQAVLAAPESR